MVTTINGKYRHINEIVTYVYVLPALKKKKRDFNDYLLCKRTLNVYI